MKDINFDIFPIFVRIREYFDGQTMTRSLQKRSGVHILAEKKMREMRMPQEKREDGKSSFYSLEFVYYAQCPPWTHQYK